jgi:diguanylate cyclase (GGDEF)-like protein/PAS domain S-box-containing protein
LNPQRFSRILFALRGLESLCPLAVMTGVSMPEPEARLFKFLEAYCKATAILVVLIACLVLCGWELNIEYLKSVVPGLVTMKANTALGIAFSGISLWLLLPGESRTRRGRIARFIALLVVLIGAATLAEYVFGVNLRIDELLFRDFRGSLGTSSPGRLAPTTATAFIAIGLALILLDWKTQRGRRASQLLSLWTGLIAMMAIIGYIYGATALYRILLSTQVALHTAIALVILSGAVFFARPRSGFAADLTGEGSGSAMARRLLPAIISIPIALGWIALQGQIAGLYRTELGLAMYATVNIIVFAVLVWLNARKMNVEHNQRNIAEAAIRELNAELEARVAERTQTLERQTAVLADQAALLDLAQDAIVVRDMESRVLFWSRGAEIMYGWPAEAAVGKVTLELLKAELPESVEKIQMELFRQGRWEGELIHHTREGVRLNVASRWALQRDANGAPVRILTINNDITERKAAENALFEEKERAQVTLNSIGDAVICTDIVGNITFLNRVAEKMTGWAWQEAKRRPMGEVFRILDALSREAIANPMDMAVAQDRTMNLPSNCILIRRDGTETPIEDSVSPIHDREGRATGAVIVFRDVSAARAMAQQMTHSAQHDFLTGLPNRMLLNDRLSQAITLAPRHTKKVAVLFLDLDGFKHINDSLGHATGDKLLQSVAKRLTDCVRGSDTVSRQGGDEFVVLLSEVERSEDAAITARRMLQAVAEAHSVDQHDLHVTTSIGVSVYPDDGLDAETLVKNADTAMYQAKEHGRQSYQFFKPTMNVRAVERQSIEESLRRALERREFMLHYQPKVNLKTGEITGAEALIRWTHPTRGLVPPGEFIPVAEDCGLILPIGNWVLREACKQARAWADAGLPPATMAVNISAMEFRSDQFLEGVFAILKETGLGARLLELELTESVLMKRAESSESILKTLRASGVRLAVDDFGTGYSSLSYLRKFPIDALKIDQSFVRQITTAPDDTAIVSAIISMGRSLNLRVVAEGVETGEELAFLRSQQCDEAQGYYFGRPVPPQQFAELLQNGVSEAVVR